MNNNFNVTLNQLYLQKEHIIQNNKDDDNYEDQLNRIEKQIKFLEEEKYYIDLVDNDYSKYNERKLYIYKGPIYDGYDKYIEESKEYYTYAKSKKEAIRNISYRIKMNLNRNKFYILHLDETYLKIKE